MAWTEIQSVKALESSCSPVALNALLCWTSWVHQGFTCQWVLQSIVRCFENLRNSSSLQILSLAFLNIAWKAIWKVCPFFLHFALDNMISRADINTLKMASGRSSTNIRLLMSERSFSGGVPFIIVFLK